MLRRLIDHELEKFYREDSHKCLVIRGVRQVGKTFSVDRLGHSDAVGSYLHVNFLERPEMKMIFSGNLDVNTLLTNFSLYLPEGRCAGKDPAFS